jgi:hypothetical protein
MAGLFYAVLAACAKRPGLTGADGGSTLASVVRVKEGNPMRLRYLTYIVLALLVFAPAALAQSIHTMAQGTEFEGKVRFSRSDVPLPPGKWILAASGNRPISTIDGGQRLSIVDATLVQVSNNSLVGLVALSGSFQPETIVWNRDRSCDRADLLFVEADRNFNNADQYCVIATHVVRSWVAADSAPDATKAIYAYLRGAGVARPPTMLSGRVRFVRGSEFIDVTYQVLPVAFGGPATRINNWATSEWHKDIVSGHPEHRRFADSWIVWTKAMAEQVKAGFGRTVTEFRSIAIGPVSPSVAAGAPVATANAVPGAFRAPRIGTRFVVADGHFEIARIDGMTISTLNASNQGATWQPGGLLPLGSETRFDRAVAESIFPLAVGKKVEFVQQAASGTDAWKQALEVVRQETLTIDGRAYTTFVVEGRTEAAGPGMAEFVRKRTLWFAPDAGWLLRFRSEQLAGPPQRTFNWDVLRIVPPS